MVIQGMRVWQGTGPTVLYGNRIRGGLGGLVKSRLRPFTSGGAKAHTAVDSEGYSLVGRTYNTSFIQLRSDCDA